MALNRTKLIKLRNDINNYLVKNDAISRVENLETTINDHTTVALQGVFQDLNDKLETLVAGTGDSTVLPDWDFTPMVKVMTEVKEEIKNSRPEAVSDRTDELIEAIAGIKVEMPRTVSVDNFPPQKIPTPVTNININGLLGPVKSTAVTVGTTATPLPTSPLDNRRSIIVWNNDNATTLWIGGEDVTVANGIPVKKQNYSPALDLSARVTLYGIVDSGSIEVRTLETSMSATGA